MASPVFLRADRTDARVQAALKAMYQQTPTQGLTPRDDVAPDLRFEIQYHTAGVDHAAAVEHLINWLEGYDAGWRQYLSVGLPGDRWT